MSVGENIRTARKIANLSQEELASAIGSTKSTVSKYELGHREPPIDTIHKIAKATGFTPAFIISGETGTSITHLDNGVHIYKSLYPHRVIAMRLNDCPPENNETIVYQDEYIIISVDDNSTASSEDIAEIIKAHRPEYLINQQSSSANANRIVEIFQKLNCVGQEEAIKRIAELAEISRYQRHYEGD